MGLIVGEQASLDAGNCSLAWELLWEPREPPYAAFAAHERAAGQRLPLTQAADPRWLEGAMAKLKDLDSLVELRKKLAKAPMTGPPQRDSGLQEEDGAPATRTRPKRPPPPKKATEEKK